MWVIVERALQNDMEVEHFHFIFSRQTLGWYMVGFNQVPYYDWLNHNNRMHQI